MRCGLFEGVRRLLKILQKKPNSFAKFCTALEKDYDWLAEQVRNTDPSKVRRVRARTCAHVSVKV